MDAYGWMTEGWMEETRDRGASLRRCVLCCSGDFAPKPQIIVPSSRLTRRYQQVCGGKIEPTLTIHKKPFVAHDVGVSCFLLCNGARIRLGARRTRGVISGEHAALSAPRGRAARALRRGKLPVSARCGEGAEPGRRGGLRAKEHTIKPGCGWFGYGTIKCNWWSWPLRRLIGN